jgi:hypothetical protein
MIGGVRRLADVERSEFAEIIGNREAGTRRINRPFINDADCIDGAGSGAICSRITKFRVGPLFNYSHDRQT